MQVGPSGVIWCMCCLSSVSAYAAQNGRPPNTPDRTLILTNDNRRPAGAFANGVVTLRLVAEEGIWQPEGPKGRTLRVQAFREESGALSIPGPLIRVPARSQIHVFIRNAIPRTTLRVFGMHERPVTGDTALDIPAGETRDARFHAGLPGTYHYWATTTGATLVQRVNVDSQLGGAFIVDAPDARVDDRIFVITVWGKPGTLPNSSDVIPTFNGRSWPFSEALDYRIGDAVHWRVVNLSFVQHAMHLHGMYFSVLSRGDGVASRAFAAGEQPVSVTEYIAPRQTFDMLWRPERTGNWLFHCHMLGHMSPDGESYLKHHQHGHDSSGGMAGLVIGIRISGEPAAAIAPPTTSRRFTLHLREEPNRYGDRPGYRVDVEGVDASRLSPGPVPAPVVVLTRGESVEITLVNHMRDPTAIHWHGIELESYFDGVPGWGGHSGSTTPAIAPGQTFTAKFTPPRAGTFIYHTHWHDEAQLSGGLYGALIVLEPGQRYDPTTDHVFIAGFDGPEVPGQRQPVVVNGMHATVPAIDPGPVPVSVRANVPNRLRLINITPDNVALTFVLTDGFKPLMWKAVAKDGADLPVQQSTVRQARQLVSVGETYDFEIKPTAGQRFWLELRRGNGEWVAQTLWLASRDGK
jgi:FtsP/CotA-like multicopper oxidase with cupredoxin domain